MDLIVIQKEELAELIENAVNKAMEKSSTLNNEAKENENDEFLNVSKAAKFLGVAVPTLYKYTSKNLIPYIKRFNNLLFRKKDLYDWLLKKAHKPKSDIRRLAKEYVDSKDLAISKKRG